MLIGQKTKRVLVALWLCLLCGIVGLLFWYNEYQYSLPTPVPANYRPVKNGQIIKTADLLELNNDKPLFLHFFNPDCPCSRFNITHFKSLVAQYRRRVNFAVVIISKRNYTAAAFRQKYDLDVPVVTNNELALRCGVYSTPQAVIITPEHRLYYRGNYNRSRYCTDEKTEYAKMALEGFLANQQHVRFSRFALQAYGCQTTDCTK